MNEGHDDSSTWSHRFRALVPGDVARTFLQSDVLLPFAASFIVVLAGISFALEFVSPPLVQQATERDPGTQRNVVSAMLSWNGERFAEIAAEGYHKDHVKRAVSFPGYPYLARGVSRALSCSVDVALLITGNLAFLVCCGLLYRYVLVTRADASPVKVARWTVLIACFCPLAIFFRVGYSESLFLAAVVAAFYGMERRWPVLAIALIIGLATSTRLVGLALVLPFVDHLRSSGRLRDQTLTSIAAIPLTCWGLLGFMAIQASVYGDPMTFVTAQRHFVTENDLPAAEMARRLVTLEPVRSVFNSRSKSYWEFADSAQNPVFNVRLLNPIVFVTFCAIVGVGWWKGTIRRGEALFSLVALGLPYLTHSVQAGMLSQARYAVIVFPAYIAMATLFRKAPSGMLVSIACVAAALLFAFSALFGASYAVY
ncbi:MAG TPA: mannosyltransferase family protein [Pirellulaceae bacterium]|nr:mannosyltransferase family protein [Pirellulaceae bacterium]